MGAGRDHIPKRVEKLLYQEAGSRCQLCGEADIVKLTVHHIEPWSECRRHDPVNMIVLCANCHSRASAGEIDHETLYEAKRGGRVIKFPQSAALTQHVVGDGNAVAGRDVVFHVSQSRRRALPRPLGTVCDDPRRVGYLQYLAKRYNQFKEWEVGEAMRYGFIHKSYERATHYAIRTTPLELFEEGAGWLQHRILSTKLGRILVARGQRVFSSFDEFDGRGDLSIPTAPHAR